MESKDKLIFMQKCLEFLHNFSQTHFPQRSLDTEGLALGTGETGMGAYSALWQLSQGQGGSRTPVAAGRHLQVLTVSRGFRSALQ